MSTLDKNQIKNIEDFLLSQYNLKYSEVRCEVLDHIACEIEEIMSETVSYEEAFKIVFSKWNVELKPSIWGVYKGIPRFVAKRVIKEDLLNHTFILSVCVVLVLISERTNLFNNVWLLKISVIISLVNCLINFTMLKTIKNILSFRMEFLKGQLKWLFLANVVFCTLNMINYTSYLENNHTFSFVALSFSTLYLLCIIGYMAIKLTTEKKRLIQHF